MRGIVRMKILHLISGGETGGSRKHLVTLLSQFPKEMVTLAVLQEGALSIEAKNAGIHVELFQQSSRYDLSILSKISQFMKNGDYDILHTHGPRANLFGRFVSSRTHVKWVTTVHSDPALDFMKTGLKGTIFTKLHLAALKKMDYYFAVSDLFKKNLVKMGIQADKIKTVYNGIEFSQNKAKSVNRYELGLDEKDFVVTMVARLHPVKGHELVFHAIKDIKLSNVKLLLVGDGPIKEELLKMVKNLDIEEQVRFLGFRDDVDALYAASDVGLLASYSESFPLALLEAANQRIPLITTDVGGVRELVSMDETGWIVPVNDSKALEEAIKSAYALWQKGILTNVGEKLYHHASNHFSLEHLYREVRETYKKIVSLEKE